MRKTIRILAIVFAVNACAVRCLSQQQDKTAEARTYYEIGNTLYKEGKYDLAQKQYQKALDLLKDVQQPVVRQQQIDQAAKAAPAAQEPLPRVIEYTIGNEDVVKISVWQNDDLNQEVIVRPDGKISFPLIGDVFARGLTITQLDEELTARLSEYVRSPEVSISLIKIGGSKVIVLGEVTRPGVYAVGGTKTILEAIGQAGGFTRDAVPSSAVLIRGGFVDPVVQRINLSKALKGRDVLNQNVILQPEDIVFIPKKFIANLHYVLSQVMDPLAKGVYIHKELEDW